MSVWAFSAFRKHARFERYVQWLPDVCLVVGHENLNDQKQCHKRGRFVCVCFEIYVRIIELLEIEADDELKSHWYALNSL